MKREHLTPDRIRRFILPAGTKQAYIWDTEAPRLAVRATAGAKSFVFESKLNRATIRTTIGDANVWTVEAARAEANRLLSLVDQGIDPREQKRERIAASEAKREEARRLDVTVGDCFQREQLPSWFAAVRRLSNPVQAAYLQALLLTGTRREELAGLRWEDVDFQWKSLHIADKVEETGRIIPLTPYVAALPRRRASHSVAGGWRQAPPASRH